MKRADFDTVIGSTQNFDDIVTETHNSQAVYDGKRCSESQSGTHGRKPSTGWIPPTNYSFSRLRYDRAVGTARVTTTVPNEDNRLVSDAIYSGCVGDGGYNTLNHCDEVYVADRDFSSLRDKALIKARIKMKGSDVNLGVAFAERNQTARLIGDTASRLGKSYRDLRRGNIRGAFEHLGYPPRTIRRQKLHKQWLEMQYAWKPLLSDVYGAASALEKQEPSNWIVTGKATAFERIRETFETGYRFDSYKGTATGTRGCFVRIDAVPGNALVGALSSLGVTNPLLVAWEVVPFSFVVDWFLPIGAYLESLDAMLGFDEDFTWCSISEFIRVEWNIQGKSSEGDLDETWPYRRQVQNDFSGSKELVELNRFASTVVPLPSLPRFKDPRSLTHMANGLSLLAAAFSR